ncbi:hypothetical protein MMC17_005581 [Xylographa soralifera]|nr:hypothetical protein [Xylographa soralifera]
MQTAPVIAISSLLLGSVLFAFFICVYRMFSRRRKYREKLAKQDLDPKSHTRIFTVMDGKVVPIQETKWANNFNGIHSPTYLTDQRRLTPTERSSHNIVSDLEAAANDEHGISTDMQPQLYYLQHASDLLGCPVYSPLKPLPRTRAPHGKRKKGQYQLDQTQPPKYSYVIKSSTTKVSNIASPRTVQQESHRPTSASRPAVPVSLQHDTNTSEAVIRKPLSAYSLPMAARMSLPSSGRHHMTTRRASNQRPSTSTPLTNREMDASLIPVPLGLLPPIVKDLPLSPIRTPEENPTTPIHNRPALQPDSPKPNFDMTVLKAASISAIPHSAFYPYRFPRSGSRQPRKSYRAILKSTETPGSLATEAPSEQCTNTKTEQVGTALVSDPGSRSAPSCPNPTSGNTGSLPPNGSPSQHKASSDSTQPRLPNPDTTLEALSWLADPSLSVSPKSSSSSRDPQQHQINTPQTSEESARMVHTSFLDPATPISGSVPDMPHEKQQSPAGPFSAFDMAQAYRIGNARCVSIYSRFATPVSRRAVPSPLLREPDRLSSTHSWRDKPLPSPRSDHSGNAASATAQSFVVSPLSSTFTP